MARLWLDTSNPERDIRTVASQPRIRRAPAFSLAVIFTLTIGIGSSTAIFGVVNAILLRPLACSNPDRLVAIVNDMPSLSMVNVGETVGIYLAYQRHAHTLERVALHQQGSANVADVDGRSGPVRLNVAYATASSLSVLGVSPIRGRLYTDAEDAPKWPKVVVISGRLWRTRFGSDPHITSRAIMLGSEQSDIVGVMPASLRFPGADVDLWVPLQIDPNTPQGGFAYDAVARLAPTASSQAAARELEELLPWAAEVTPTLTPNGMAMTTVLAQAKPIPRVLPLRDELVGGAAGTLRLVAAAAVLAMKPHADVARSAVVSSGILTAKRFRRSRTRPHAFSTDVESLNEPATVWSRRNDGGVGGQSRSISNHLILRMLC